MTTTSAHPESTRAQQRPARATVIAVGAAATVRAVAIPVAWWTLYGVAVELQTGSGRGAVERATSAVATIAVGIGASALALLIAGPIVMAWLQRARSGSPSTARHRLGPGWTVGSWLVPVANYVLPWIVVVDVWRASAPDPTSRPTPVHGWWLATSAARLAHLTGWILLIASFSTYEPADTFWTVAVLHTAGSVLGLASAGLLGLTVIEIDRGLRDLATRPDVAGSPTQVGERLSDPLVPDGLFGVYGRVLATLRRSWRHLLALEAITAAASVAYILIVWPTRWGPGGTADPGGRPTLRPVGTAEWAAIALPTLVVVVAVFMIVRSASTVVILRQAIGRPVTVGEGLREAVRRAPRLVGWTLLVLGVLFAIGYLAIGSGSLLVIALILLPSCAVLGLVLNVTLVGVVTVEGGHLGRCCTLLRGRFWRAFGRYLSVLPLVAVVSIPLNIAYATIGDPTSRAAVLAVIAVPLYVFVSAFAAVMYADLRCHESGGRVLTRHLVAQMDDAGHPAPDTGPPSPVEDVATPSGH